MRCKDRRDERGKAGMGVSTCARSGPLRGHGRVCRARRRKQPTQWGRPALWKVWREGSGSWLLPAHKRVERAKEKKMKCHCDRRRGVVGQGHVAHPAMASTASTLSPHSVRPVPGRRRLSGGAPERHRNACQVGDEKGNGVFGRSDERRTIIWACRAAVALPSQRQKVVQRRHQAVCTPQVRRRVLVVCWRPACTLQVKRGLGHSGERPPHTIIGRQLVQAAANSGKLRDHTSGRLSERASEREREGVCVCACVHADGPLSRREMMDSALTRSTDSWVP